MSKIAGLVEVESVLRSLSLQRPVFHSEADFQHAFAWEVQRSDPHMQVRLEIRIAPHQHLDLLCHRPDTDRYTAVELKYPTASWSGSHASEQFRLHHHSATDVSGYRIVKDIQRLEQDVAGRDGWDGLLIVLTNEAFYWHAPAHQHPTNADAFRVHEGTRLAGVRRWGPNTGAGTMKGHEEAIGLAGIYDLRWQHYSHLDGPHGEFRSLVVAVGG